MLGILAIQEQSHGTHNINAIINDLESYCDNRNMRCELRIFVWQRLRSSKMCIERLDRSSKTKQTSSRIGNCESGPNSVGRRRGSESRQQGNSQSGRATSSHNHRTLLYGAEFAQVQSHPSLAAGWDPGNSMWSSGPSTESGLGRSPQISEAFTSN
jgi:hypothetical protein